jgi:hypothetical protein
MIPWGIKREGLRKSITQDVNPGEAHGEVRPWMLHDQPQREPHFETSSTIGVTLVLGGTADFKDHSPRDMV